MERAHSQNSHDLQQLFSWKLSLLLLFARLLHGALLTVFIESSIGNKKEMKGGRAGNRRKESEPMLGSDSSEETDVKVMSSLISDHH